MKTKLKNEVDKSVIETDIQSHTNSTSQDKQFNEGKFDRL